MAEEVSQDLGEGEEDLAVGQAAAAALVGVLAEEQGALLRARGARVKDLAGEGTEELGLAVRVCALDLGDALGVVPAVQEALDGPGDAVSPELAQPRGELGLRCGTANVFGVVEPKAGRHFTRATVDRSAPQFARLIQELTGRYATARTMHLVMDNKARKTFRHGMSRLWNQFSRSRN